MAKHYGVRQRQEYIEQIVQDARAGRDWIKMHTAVMLFNDITPNEIRDLLKSGKARESNPVQFHDLSPEKQKMRSRVLTMVATASMEGQCNSIALSTMNRFAITQDELKEKIKELKENGFSDGYLSASRAAPNAARAMIFEVIVRQAISVPNWEQLLAGTMQVQNISAEEVRRELERRSRLIGHTLSEEQRMQQSQSSSQSNVLCQSTATVPLHAATAQSTPLVQSAPRNQPIDTTRPEPQVGQSGPHNQPTDTVRTVPQVQSAPHNQPIDTVRTVPQVQSAPHNQPIGTIRPEPQVGQSGPHNQPIGTVRPVPHNQVRPISQAMAAAQSQAPSQREGTSPLRPRQLTPIVALTDASTRTTFIGQASSAATAAYSEDGGSITFTTALCLVPSVDCNMERALEPKADRATFRAMTLDVIAKQAMRGLPWRETCLELMMRYGISHRDVESRARFIEIADARQRETIVPSISATMNGSCAPPAETIPQVSFAGSERPALLPSETIDVSPALDAGRCFACTLRLACVCLEHEIAALIDQAREACQRREYLLVKEFCKLSSKGRARQSALAELLRNVEPLLEDLPGANSVCAMNTEAESSSQEVIAHLQSLVKQAVDALIEESIVSLRHRQFKVAQEFQSKSLALEELAYKLQDL